MITYQIQSRNNYVEMLLGIIVLKDRLVCGSDKKSEITENAIRLILHDQLFLLIF